MTARPALAAARPIWQSCFATGVVVFAVAVFGIELTRETGRIAALWGANAALLAALLNSPRERAAAISLAGLAGNVAANLATGDGLGMSLALPICNLVEVLICYVGLAWSGDRDLTRTRTLAIFCAIAAGPASIASAVLAAGLLAGMSHANFGETAIAWYAADALGLITFTPLFSSIAARRVGGAVPAQRSSRAVFTALFFAMALAVVFLQSRYPLLFIAFPALIVVAFQFGFFGASVALVATALVALVATVNHLGPLSLVHGGLREQIAVLQAFLAVSALMSLAVAAVLAERERLTAQREAARAEAEAAQRRLRESEARYRLLAEHTSDVIVLSTFDGRLDYVSPSVTAILGYSADEFVSRPIATLVHAEDLPRVVALRHGLGTDRPKATSVHRLQTASGDYLWIEAAYAFVPGSDGGPAAILAVVRDISERQAHAAQLDAAREAAEAGLKAKSEFLAMMSHELRTPLNSIIGFSGLLREGDELKTHSGRRYARNIETSSRVLLSIVNDVMDVSKLEAGALELDVRPFSVRRLVNDAAVVMRGEAQAKALFFEVEVDASIPDRLVGDDARLRQVLLNLLSNAVKFTAQGGVTLRLERVAAGPDEASLRISVQDSGIGIPEDKLHRLFKRFSQVDQTTARRFGGAGLGLSISSDLIGLMSGSITVSSREGVGTRFEISLTLPVAAADRPRPALVPAEDAPSSGGLRILVAEDVAINQELLTALLSRWSYSVDLAADGAEAVAAAAARGYDVILMDVQMPGMDGVEATRRIRASEGPSRNAAIIALTANVLPDEVARFRAAGMDDHVGKPFAPDALKVAIERCRRAAEAEAPFVPAARRSHMAGEPVFDARALEELSGLVGRSAIQSYLGKLEAELETSFLLPPQAGGDLTALRYEAHAMASTAGMLGFRRLSGACVDLENVIDSRESVSTILNRFGSTLAARDEALPALRGQLRPEVRDAG